MTDAERALWAQARQDYQHAYLLAAEALPKGTPAEVLQAATATILIHITKLRSEVPRNAAPAAGKRDDNHSPAASQAPVAVPPCPQCGGRTKRVEKRGEKSPDFQCLQDNGKCGKASKDGNKWFATGVWAKDLKKSPALAQAGAIRDGIDSYSDMPESLQDGDDDLPF